MEDASAQPSQEEDPMEEYQSYVMGMLQNRPSASVQTIHSMMELMMDEFDMTPEDLKKWLDTLVIAGLMVHDNGEYKKA